LFSPTAIRVPTNFSFRKCYNDVKGIIFTRIYFLAPAQVSEVYLDEILEGFFCLRKIFLSQVGRENTIMYVDIYDSTVGDTQLAWNPMIDLSFQPGLILLLKII